MKVSVRKKPPLSACLRDWSEQFRSLPWAVIFPPLGPCSLFFFISIFFGSPWLFITTSSSPSPTYDFSLTTSLALVVFLILFSSQILVLVRVLSPCVRVAIEGRRCGVAEGWGKCQVWNGVTTIRYRCFLKARRERGGLGAEPALRGQIGHVCF